MSRNIGKNINGLIMSTENIRKMRDDATDETIKKFITKIVRNMENCNIMAIVEVENKIKREIAEYNENFDVTVEVSTHRLCIKLPDYIRWDASDLLTIELYFNCTFVQTTFSRGYRIYEFKWVVD